MKRRGQRDTDSSLENVISYVLIIGVLTSLLLEIGGMMLFYHSYRSLAISHERWAFLRGENFSRFMAQLFSGSHAESSMAKSIGSSISLITLGIAVLILTPYVRALLSVVYFAARGNRKYFAITLFVVVLLTISLFLH
jgi:uncharacterized membrane protein